MIGSRLGPYEITGKLGEGGMGEVYRATDTKLKREVAIKVLPPAFIEDGERLARFEREAQVLAQLHHPNIASIFGLEESGGVRALVMELVEGPTLADRLAQGGLSLEESLSIARQIAEALEEAHERGIVHRDLKPQNIKAAAEGKVKVLDFGLAKAMDPNAGATASATDMARSPTLTSAGSRVGMILGTAAYMAPEQAKGFTVDKRADIWAFGVVLFEMLAGRPLFDGDSVSETLAGVLKDEIDLGVLPAATPAAIRRLLRRCLERNPKNRLHDIADARIVIDEVLAGGVKESEAAPAAAPVARPRLRWLPWAIVALALIAAAYFGLRGGTAPPSAPQPTVRFDMAWPGPSATSIDLSRDYFELSPDGRFMLFVAENQIWVRALDALAARALPDTTGATYPFWSPDGASIGFFANRELRRIARDGGQAQKLCDAPGGRGAAWGPDGTIVFSAEYGTAGLSRVGERGGTPARLPRVTSSPESTGDHRYPQFLPDGRHFLFTYLSGSPKAAGIYVGDLDGARPVRVLDGSEQARFAPASPPGETGFLLYRRRDVLMAQPFDPKVPATAGEAVPLIEDVGGSANTGHGAFAVSDSGILAHTQSANRKQELVWFDRGGRRLETVIERAGWFWGFSISPDGRTLAFCWSEGAASSDIWLQALPGGAPSRFTFGPAPGWTLPTWSPDSRELALCTYTLSGISHYQIQRRRVDRTGVEETLHDTPILMYLWDWSPDGRQLVFESDVPQALWLLPLGGKHEPIAVGTGQESQAKFSPDGRWLAYTSMEGSPNQVFVRPLPDTGAKWQISTAGGSMPQWRRDGRELYYRAADGTIQAVAVRADGSSFEIGDRQALFGGVPADPGGWYPTFEAAPDGRRFLVQLRSAESEAPITVVLNWQNALRR
jgi:eukaryotic-like serine/threonine-protein kinase